MTCYCQFLQFEQFEPKTQIYLKQNTLFDSVHDHRCSTNDSSLYDIHKVLNNGVQWPFHDYLACIFFKRFWIEIYWNNCIKNDFIWHWKLTEQKDWSCMFLAVKQHLFFSKHNCKEGKNENGFRITQICFVFLNLVIFLNMQQQRTKRQITESSVKA